MPDELTDIAGRRVRLLPERALYLEEANTLVAADIHWGKAAAFRAEGVLVPSGSTRDGLARLTSALERTGAKELVILGDLFHARAGRSPRLLESVRLWRDRHQGLDVVLVRGNHDASAGDPPEELGFRCVNEPFRRSGLSFRHHPEADRGRYVLAGHLHPAVVLAGKARQRERLPCFCLGRRLAILPAFGGFTGTAAITPRATDRVFVVAGGRILPV